jgi:hypothetical protein
MSPTKPNKPEKTESPKTPETASADAVSAPANPQAEASSKTEKSGKSSSRDGKRILSVGIPDKLARQLKLLCNVEGVSASSIVIAAVQRAVNKRLGAALESIKPDVEG